LSAVIPEHAGIETIVSQSLDARVRGHDKGATRRFMLEEFGVGPGPFNQERASARTKLIPSRLFKSQNG
jgi:hypothetical protein